MTYGNNEEYPFTAHDIVNSWDEENIVSILQGYGEERFAKRIARGIVTARVNGSINTTFALTKIIESSVPPLYRYGKINPSTRTFQALRMTVNDELGALEAFLEKGMNLLRHGGRLAVITFHSLEDRIVKHTFKQFVHDSRGLLVTKKPIVASRDEVRANKRARSAHLRTIEKI
jgi:16S rRNA (cytosine1402-N4)-methyltransferase